MLISPSDTGRSDPKSQQNAEGSEDRRTAAANVGVIQDTLNVALL